MDTQNLAQNAAGPVRFDRINEFLLAICNICNADKTINFRAITATGNYSMGFNYKPQREIYEGLMTYEMCMWQYYQSV